LRGAPIFVAARVRCPTRLSQWFLVAAQPAVCRNDDWLIVKTIVEDPTYLSEPYTTSSQFKREPDGSKWNPTPCERLPQVKPPAPLGR